MHITEKSRKLFTRWATNVFVKWPSSGHEKCFLAEVCVKFWKSSQQFSLVHDKRSTIEMTYQFHCLSAQTRHVPVTKPGGWDKCLGPFDHYQAKDHGIDVWDCHDNCYARVDRQGSEWSQLGTNTGLCVGIFAKCFPSLFSAGQKEKLIPTKTNFPDKYD